MSLELFDKALSLIEKNAKIKESGGHIGIPYPFRELNKELSGIQEGEVHMITAGTGVSKSKYTRFVYIYNVYKFYLRTNYKVKILYFPLEDSDTKIMLHLMVYYIYEKYNIRTDIKQLLSHGTTVTADLVRKLQEARSYFSRLLEILDIYPEATTPDEIYNIAIKWAVQVGTLRKSDDGRIIGYDRNPLHSFHTILIVDNLSNVTAGSKYRDKHEAIGNLTSDKTRKVLSKLFEFTVVLDAQQDLASDRAQYANDGKSIQDKLMPTINGLATNKESARDMHIIFGIFAPHRYGILEWPKLPKDGPHRGYNIGLLGNYFRQLQVLKNNEGNTDFKIPLWFDGQIEIFEQMPHYTADTRVEEYYNRVRAIREEQQGQRELFRFS